MSKKTEKKRCSNFSTVEIELLIKLVEERRDILKCPKLDAITVEKRNLAWREITKIFNRNEAITVFRNEEKLKKKYSNIRCERNKINRNTTKTEQGTQNQEIAQANDNAVAEIVVVKTDDPDEISCNNIDSSKTVLKESTMVECNEIKRELTEDCSAGFSESSSITDDELPNELNENEEKVKLAHKKIGEVNKNIIQDNNKLNLEIIELEHKQAMTYKQTAHELRKEILLLKRKKYELELEYLNKEIAFMRKMSKKVGNFN